ncbi:NADH-quinone oxidoreductase subunit C [Cohnella zeiphila]|uniref:NADH-quinone oxidoreductase subunit C n=1 Tax=Cohnella zeiphila TaxID=2761120 RepID=A0A7X0VX13_9BACL|nr:NADH-quinone oxidoreductase subunit C [Cohnella zeiphila]MBB6732982.1 NADH-quinone oxidoreductase subunit C [Cohnella zeiphila]
MSGEDRREESAKLNETKGEERRETEEEAPTEGSAGTSAEGAGTTPTDAPAEGDNREDVPSAEADSGAAGAGADPNGRKPEGEEQASAPKQVQAAAEPKTGPVDAKQAAEGEPAAPPAKAAEEAAAPAASSAGGEAPVRRQETDEEKAARRKAALEAREAAKAAAAQGAARPEAAGGAAAAGRNPAAAAGRAAPAAADAPPPPPSPNQPRLDRAAQLLRELVNEDAVEEASINEPNDHLPTLVIKRDRWQACAGLFRSHPELNIDYLRNVAGVDHETHMEVIYHLLSLDSGHNYAVKVRTDRESPSVPSVTPIWPTANWNEREIYDLLGIDFPGHPDLRRIMMPDDWVGHPLRKDYAPLDPEV